jgi:hypothetical protein
MSSFLEKLVRRYKMIYPEENNILPITLTNDIQKCKDFDVDKVDFRYNTLPIFKEKNNKNKVVYDSNIACNNV